VWVRVDDQVPLIRSSRGRTMASCMDLRQLYCDKYLTDGHIPARRSKPRPNLRPIITTQARAAARQGRLWEIEDGGWRVHDFHHYNPTAQEVRRNGNKIGNCVNPHGIQPESRRNLHGILSAPRARSQSQSQSQYRRTDTHTARDGWTFLSTEATLLWESLRPGIPASGVSST